MARYTGCPNARASQPGALQKLRFLQQMNACVHWAHNMTSKNLHHLQMRENAVQEVVQTNFATVEHVGGKINLSDIFTKEDRDKQHYLTACYHLVCPHLSLERGVTTAHQVWMWLGGKTLCTFTDAVQPSPQIVALVMTPGNQESPKFRKLPLFFKGGVDALPSILLSVRPDEEIT
eukprot:6592136-Ditylum_brightwellii.AAC.1